MENGKCCKQTGTCCKDVGKENIVTNEEPKYIKHPSIEELYSSAVRENEQKPISETICYNPVFTCAENITDLTVLLAKSFLTGTHPKKQPEYEKLQQQTNVWPKARELTYSSGFEAITRYLESLDYDRSLMFCVDFIQQNVTITSTEFVYEVKWSIPTKEQPVQLSTANMYFKLKSCYEYYEDGQIDVTFVYENSNLIFRPGDCKLKENWLLNIMHAKMEFRDINEFKINNLI